MMPSSAATIEVNAMKADKMYDSLATIELMLEDLKDGYSANPQMTDTISQHLQAAMKHVSTARKMHSISMMPKLSEKKLGEGEVEEIAKTLSRQERWVIRHLGKRHSVSASLIGSEKSRITEMGFIREQEGVISLTEKGSLLDKVMVSGSAASC